MYQRPLFYEIFHPLSRRLPSANPLLRSGLVLAGANRIGAPKPTAIADDGWVTAQEVSALDLHGTELVVLSSCESGLGDVRAGEGVMGLRRSFLNAGARTLLTSLYEVPDDQTRQLMERFYAGLKAGRSKLDSLHEAQIDLIRHRRGRYLAAHSFFWAGFVLVGDPG